MLLHEIQPSDKHNFLTTKLLEIYNVILYPDQAYLARPSQVLSLADDVLGTTIRLSPSLSHFRHKKI